MIPPPTADGSRSVHERRDRLDEISSSFEMTVERGKVREFARAVHSKNTEYFDDPNTVVPPTFLATAAWWPPHEVSLLDQLGLDRERTLHGEQEYVFHGMPPRVGATLAGTTRIEADYRRQGRRGGELRFVVLRTEFRDPDGQVVAEARTTVVEVERPPAR